MMFALIASFLWIVSSIYSIGYMRGKNEGHQTRFFVCFALRRQRAHGRTRRQYVDALHRI